MVQAECVLTEQFNSRHTSLTTDKSNLSDDNDRAFFFVCV